MLRRISSARYSQYNVDGLLSFSISVENGVITCDRIINDEPRPRRIPPSNYPF